MNCVLRLFAITAARWPTQGYEYGVMTDMLESSDGLLPDQISIEVHAASHESPPLMASRGGHRFDGGVAAHAKAVKSPGELALFGHFLNFHKVT